MREVIFKEEKYETLEVEQTFQRKLKFKHSFKDFNPYNLAKE